MKWVLSVALSALLLGAIAGVIALFELFVWLPIVLCSIVAIGLLAWVIHDCLPNSGECA